MIWHLPDPREHPWTVCSVPLLKVRLSGAGEEAKTREMNWASPEKGGCEKGMAERRGSPGQQPMGVPVWGCRVLGGDEGTQVNPCSWSGSWWR